MSVSTLTAERKEGALEQCIVVKKSPVAEALTQTNMCHNENSITHIR